jgi:alpha-1,3/alpha-1,6-mannosyltransferase
MAVARMFMLAQAAMRQAGGFDVIFCDAVAQAVPLLRRYSGAPVVFYCHFPDLLTTPPRRGWYRWYRVPLDRWEAVGMRVADRVLVNSAFTAGMVRDTFPGLPRAPEVLYPGVDMDRHAGATTSSPSASTTLVAISRLVPIKNLDLALEAYAQVRALVAPAVFAATRLVIGGAHDARLPESTATVHGLRARAAALGLSAQVTVHCSPSDAERRALLSGARCLVYTPSREHFGYVPIEAMAAGRPVLAVNDGGPTETVVEGETGFLRPASASAFAEALRRLLTEPATADRLGRAGRARAEREFSLTRFGAQLDALMREVVENRTTGTGPRKAGKL